MPAFTAGQLEFLERPQKTAKAGINFLRSSDFLSVDPRFQNIEKFISY
jgi:hypothetical protein